MKNFLRVRNIIIILIVIVAIAIFLYMKQDNVYESKTYKYFYNVGEWWKFACTLEDKKENTVKEVYAKDCENSTEYLKIHLSKKAMEKLSEIIKLDPNVDYNEEAIPDELNYKYIAFSNEEKEILYFVSDNEKLYTKTDETDASLMVSDNSWFYGISKIVSSANGYIRGFEFVEGKLLYFESFKTTESGDVKVYFENDEIKYVKFEKLNLLELTVEHLDETGIPKEWTKIPEDYKDTEKLAEEYNKENGKLDLKD